MSASLFCYTMQQSQRFSNRGPHRVAKDAGVMGSQERTVTLDFFFPCVAFVFLKSSSQFSIIVGGLSALLLYYLLSVHLTLTRRLFLKELILLSCN